jgi:hypothetical protein
MNLKKKCLWKHYIFPFVEETNSIIVQYFFLFVYSALNLIQETKINNVSFLLVGLKLLATKSSNKKKLKRKTNNKKNIK